MNQNEIKSEISKIWDEEAEHYDTHVSHGILTETEKDLWKEAFQSILPFGIRLRILDVGCGTGSIGLILAEMGHDVTGIDLSKKMMDEGRKKACNHDLTMKFQYGDAENTPFQENSFDVVINRHLFWTLPHPEKALENWYKVLKPGGILVIVEGIWNDGTLRTEICRRLSNLFTGIIESHPHGNKGYPDKISQSLPNIRGLSRQNAQKELYDAGFMNIKTFDLGKIRLDQYKRLRWYKKIAYGMDYYMISGKKTKNNS